MVIGEYLHTLDDKNRLSFPAKFRKEVGKTVVITPGLDQCLFVFTTKEWETISSKLSESSLLQADNRSFHRYLFGGAVEVTFDTLGRVLIPDFLKARAGLKGKVAVVGVHNRIELWDGDTWNKYKRDVEGRADALAEKLGSVGAL